MTRQQHVPWKAAGAASEQRHSADDVVRHTGWVFNNKVGRELTLSEFVDSGDHEMGAYLEALGLHHPDESTHTIVEIGSGIGRMTAGFTRTFGNVVACDLDAAFLERCRETVAQFGKPERLHTSHVADGRTLSLPSATADLTFSYITLQHCQPDDALALVGEAVRVTRPGGSIALNMRTWVPADVALWPLGSAIRGLFRVPGLGGFLARRRSTARLGWQANRLTPARVVPAVAGQLADVKIFRSPSRRPFGVEGTSDEVFGGINPSHWWLVARVAG